VHTGFVIAYPAGKYICIEAFAATEFNEIFSGRQPLQDVKFLRSFRNTAPIFRVCWWFGSTKTDDWVSKSAMTSQKE
jgi:hypothetical protein